MFEKIRRAVAVDVRSARDEKWDVQLNSPGRNGGFRVELFPAEGLQVPIQARFFKRTDTQITVSAHSRDDPEEKQIYIATVHFKEDICILEVRKPSAKDSMLLDPDGFSRLVLEPMFFDTP